MQSIPHMVVGTRSSDDEQGERFFVALQAQPRQLPGGQTSPAGMRFEVEFPDASDADRALYKKGVLVNLPAPIAAKA